MFYYILKRVVYIVFSFNLQKNGIEGYQLVILWQSKCSIQKKEDRLGWSS